MNRSLSGTHTYVTHRGLYLCVDPIKKIFVKIPASRVRSFLVPDGYIQILAEDRVTVLRVVYIHEQNKIWACTEKEFTLKTIL